MWGFTTGMSGKLNNHDLSGQDKFESNQVENALLIRITIFLP